MRIEIDEDLEKKLDAIKTKKWFSGKGHTETIRFLIDHYEQTQSIEKMIDQKLSDVDRTIEQSILKGFKRVIQNIIGGGQ
jgi:hypothetical protein